MNKKNQELAQANKEVAELKAISMNHQTEAKQHQELIQSLQEQLQRIKAKKAEPSEISKARIKAISFLAVSN